MPVGLAPHGRGGEPTPFGGPPDIPIPSIKYPKKKKKKFYPAGETPPEEPPTTPPPTPPPGPPTKPTKPTKPPRKTTPAPPPKPAQPAIGPGPVYPPVGPGPATGGPLGPRPTPNPPGPQFPPYPPKGEVLEGELMPMDDPDLPKITKKPDDTLEGEVVGENELGPGRRAIEGPAKPRPAPPTPPTVAPPGGGGAGIGSGVRRLELGSAEDWDRPRTPISPPKGLPSQPTEPDDLFIPLNSGTEEDRSTSSGRRRRIPKVTYETPTIAAPDTPMGRLQLMGEMARTGKQPSTPAAKPDTEPPSREATPPDVALPRMGEAISGAPQLEGGRTMGIFRKPDTEPEPFEYRTTPQEGPSLADRLISKRQEREAEEKQSGGLGHALRTVAESTVEGAAEGVVLGAMVPGLGETGASEAAGGAVGAERGFVSGLAKAGLKGATKGATKGVFKARKNKGQPTRSYRNPDS